MRRETILGETRVTKRLPVKLSAERGKNMIRQLKLWIGFPIRLILGIIILFFASLIAFFMLSIVPKEITWTSSRKFLLQWWQFIAYGESI